MTPDLRLRLSVATVHYGVRRQAKRDAALDSDPKPEIRMQSEEKRRRASLAAALHIFLTDGFNRTMTLR